MRTTDRLSDGPENPAPGSRPGTTRIVAGDPARPKRKRTLEISLAAGLALLIGAGAAVASSVARGSDAPAAQAAAAGTPAA